MPFCLSEIAFTNFGSFTLDFTSSSFLSKSSLLGLVSIEVKINNRFDLYDCKEIRNIGFIINNYSIMTVKEAINEIKSGVKPYEQIDPKMKQSKFSDMCMRAENGLLKPDTLRSFLERFGYSLDVELKANKI